MKTKLFTLLLAIAASVGTMFAQQVQIGDLYYNLDATNQTAEMTYRYYDYYSGDIIIPASVTYNEITYSVTSIGKSAFYECSRLTSVTIPNSVTSIGGRAFYNCVSLTSVTIPNSVTSIGNGAFFGCSALTSIDVSSNNPNYCSMDGVLFNKDKTTLIQCPEGKQGAYTIPNSVTSIGDEAFYKCTGLTSINVASDNPNYCSVNGVLFNKNRTTLISYPGGKQGAYTIPNSVTSIGDGAFRYCTGLTSVTIGNSVTSIGDYAFGGCSGLTSVTIPNSVTSIGERAFYGCTGLTSVTIPNSVTYIGDDAFCYCTGLTSVTIGNSVTSIGIYAFIFCYSLTSPVYNAHVFAYMPTSYSGAYTIPDGIESIAGGAFSGCSGLTSVTIGNSVTSIGNEAFSYCSSLTSVTIPNSVTRIGNHAFAYCSGLTSVTIPNSVTSIGDGAFINCTGLTSVTIPNSVTRIGNDAFNYCTGLTSVTIPNSVTSIGIEAFRDCTGLTSLTIGNSVTSIGDWAFFYCTGLTSVTNFANTPQEIDSNDFYCVNKSTCVLYVPAGSISAYKSTYHWEDFTNILPIGAQPVDVTTTTVTPSETTADIAWPQVTGAATYTIEIKKNGELICTLTFNAQGQLISIAFNAPSRNNAPQQAQAAGFSFTVTSLDSGTTYSYTMTAKGNNGNVLKTESGTFTTTGDAQGVEEVLSNQVPSTKILHNGQIFIIRGDKTYTITGQKVK